MRIKPTPGTYHLNGDDGTSALISITSEGAVYFVPMPFGPPVQIPLEWVDIPNGPVLIGTIPPFGVTIYLGFEPPNAFGGWSQDRHGDTIPGSDCEGTYEPM